jgi:NADPH:quinone reductase
MKVKVAELSRKPVALTHSEAASVGLSLVCAWIAVHRLSEVKPKDNVLVIGKSTFLIHALVGVHRLVGARGGIGSGVIQLLKEKGITNIYGTYRTIPSGTPSGLKPIALPNATAISTALKASGDFGKMDVLVDCAGYEDPLNDALKAMRDQGRVVVMAAHRPDGRFSIDLRTFYMKSLVMKGLKSSLMNESEVKEMLDYLSGRYDDGSIEAPKKVGTVPMKDLSAVCKALETVTTRSQDRIVILP